MRRALIAAAVVVLLPIVLIAGALIHLSLKPDPKDDAMVVATGTPSGTSPADPSATPSPASGGTETPSGTATDKPVEDVLPGADVLDIERKPITMDEVRNAFSSKTLKKLSDKERMALLLDVAQRLPTLNDIQIDRLVHDPPFLWSIMRLRDKERWPVVKPYLAYRQWRFIRQAYIYYNRVPEDKRREALDAHIDEFLAVEKARESDFVQSAVDKMLKELGKMISEQRDKELGRPDNPEDRMFPENISPELKELTKKYWLEMEKRAEERGLDWGREDRDEDEEEIFGKSDKDVKKTPSAPEKAPAAPEVAPASADPKEMGTDGDAKPASQP